MNSNASGIAGKTLASTDTSGGIGNLSNRFALDVQGFDAMRAQANASPQQGLKSAAKQFDAVFTQMMLKSMRDATPSDSPFESSESKSFTSMLDQQLSQQMSSTQLPEMQSIGSTQVWPMPYGCAEAGEG